MRERCGWSWDGDPKAFRPNSLLHCSMEMGNALCKEKYASLSRKLTRAGIWRDEGGGSCGDLWPEEDVVSEVVEAPDQGGALACLLIQEGLSKFLKGNGFGEHVEHGDQDLVRDGGPQRTPTRLQPVVLVLVVAALRPGSADLNKSRLEVNVALAGGRALLL